MFSMFFWFFRGGSGDMKVSSVLYVTSGAVCLKHSVKHIFVIVFLFQYLCLKCVHDCKRQYCKSEPYFGGLNHLFFYLNVMTLR